MKVEQQSPQRSFVAVSTLPPGECCLHKGCLFIAVSMASSVISDTAVDETLQSVLFDPRDGGLLVLDNSTEVQVVDKVKLVYE